MHNEYRVCICLFVAHSKPTVVVVFALFSITTSFYCWTRVYFEAIAYATCAGRNGIMNRKARAKGTARLWERRKSQKKRCLPEQNGNLVDLEAQILNSSPS